MKPSLLQVSFTTFFLLASAEHLAFALPSLAIILLLHLLEIQAALFLFLVFIISSPIAALIAWLIAKGSNWMNTAASIKAIGAMAGQLYGLLLGGLFGARFFSPIGTLLTAGLFFALGIFAGIGLGSVAANRLIASGNPADTSDDVFPTQSK